MKFPNDGCVRRREALSMMMKIFFNTLFLLSFCCGYTQQSASLNRLLNDTAVRGAHVGVHIYDPIKKQAVLSYQADKYFVPASNVKIVTCYAAMKYLKHILAGIRYYENDTAIYLVPTGDPTLLHRDFLNQPVIKFLQLQPKKIFITDRNWLDKELGKGWSWDDFSDEYMTERNALPVYGNTLKWVQQKVRSNSMSMEESFSMYSDPEVNWKVRFDPDPLKLDFEVKRDRHENIFSITEGTDPFKEVYVPFITGGLSAALELLPDTIHKQIAIANNFLLSDPDKRTISSQPTDSVLRPMMYRSDNFFAEQLLLMVSEEMFGVMDAELAIDSLIRTDFAKLPKAPVWVDGSGLSRYNLFTPSAFVRILDSMRLQFGMERLQAIFPMGDSGTLKGMFQGGANPYVYAKTGSMSGVVALSGFLYTRDRRPLIFSVLINNFPGKARNVRRAVEKFVKEIR